MTIMVIMVMMVISYNELAAHAASAASHASKKKVLGSLIDVTYRWPNLAGFRNIPSPYHIQQHIQISAF